LTQQLPLKQTSVPALHVPQAFAPPQVFGAGPHTKAPQFGCSVPVQVPQPNGSGKETPTQKFPEVEQSGVQHGPRLQFIVSDQLPPHPSVQVLVFVPGPQLALQEIVSQEGQDVDGEQA